MTERREDIVVLIDEDGEEEEFEFIDSIEMDGSEYVVLSPVGKEDDEFFDMDDEVVLLKVETDKDGEESYVTIEDDDELDAVFEEFKTRMEDIFDFDIEEDDDDDDDDDYDEFYDNDDDDDDDYDNDDEY